MEKSKVLMNEKVIQSFKKLEGYCEQENYEGWDPYDGLMSKVFRGLPILPNKKLSRLIWIQLIKKLPVNLRKPLKIEKGFNPKGLGLFISAYSNLSEIEGRYSESVNKIEFLFEKVMNLRSEGFSGNCWGYNFDWESRAFFQKQFSPTIVATTYVANALLDAFEVTRNENYLDAAISAKDFILNDLNRSYDKSGNFAFSYSPFDKTSVFNASLLGARLISRIYSYTKEEELIATAKKAVAYVCNYQNHDGSWYYSTLPFHQWIDNFHTGFNLECIFEYQRYSKDISFKENFDKGIHFYLETFFDKEGRSKYYNNSLYPIDIHAASQLIVTLAKTNLLKQHQKLADRVLSWTIENMQSPEGYFYFQKRKYYTNKIPFMRWSEAWIFYAMSFYLVNAEKALEKSTLLN
ncbi:MAG: hypothetical protein ACTHOB_18695 [Ginsengibacter sp.]